MSLTLGDQDRPELRKLIEGMIESGFTGVTMRLHDEQGEWVGSAGARELGGTEKPPVDGYVRIGSNTKTFTAALVLRLVAEGAIELDAPAADHLPGFGLDPRITVRMLLRHTSGVFNFTGEYHADGTFTPGIPATNTGQEWVDKRFTAYQPEELVRLALSRPARFEPGTGWSYSNTNYVLLRLLVEKATGRSFAGEMRRLVLEPLGLSDTLVPDGDPELPEPHARAYYRYEDAGRTETVDVTRHDPSWISTGGDMISTTRDLHTFISSLLSGKLLPAPLLAEMCEPHPETGYGLGLFVQQASGNGGTVITHNGGVAGHGALMYSTADGSKTLIAALNYVDDAALSLAGAFQKAVAQLVEEVFGGQDTPAAER
ncbi:serine hydrolase domain-containing protein [Streptomyces amakusaensis]|uniref:Serine hydrolase domain-containing protein n=1 Tax=Streptomyces amakusaensis TaxID=67271 RepID=A0ABW0ATZ2_9ACTN